MSPDEKGFPWKQVAAPVISGIAIDGPTFGHLDGAYVQALTYHQFGQASVFMWAIVGVAAINAIGILIYLVIRSLEAPKKKRRRRRADLGKSNPPSIES